MSGSNLGRTARSWWASSDRSARGALVGGVGLTLALFGTSAVVWVSPELSPVTTVKQVTEAITGSDRILDERGQLLSQVVELSSRLTAQATELESTESQLESTQGALETARQQLASAQAKLDSASGTSPAKPGSKSPVAAPITAPSKAELVAPASPYFGMYTEQAPFNWATMDATAAKIGGAPSMVGYFSGWDEDFRDEAVTRSWQRGKLPMMTWESRPIGSANNVVDEPEYSLPRIIGGEFDDYLRGYAADIVSTGMPLAIRLDHEMNGVWYPWSETTAGGFSLNGNSRGDYVAMWKHVHDIFEAAGANDYVIWVWAPNRVDNLPTALQTPERLASLYPGDDYVDWVGMSGYLRPPFDDAEEHTFDETFGATLSQLRGLTSKPILLAEVGASEIEGHKPGWIASFFQSLTAEENRDIIGFSWFSLAITTYVEGSRATNDWRIDSRDDSLAAFRTGLLAPGSRFDVRPVN